MGVQSEALEKVNNNLNAIRIEQQTAGKRKVAFPVEPFSGSDERNIRGGISSDIDDARETEYDDVKNATDASTALSEAERIMRRASRTKTLSETEADTDAEETKSDFPVPPVPALLPPRGRRSRRSEKKPATDLKKELKEQGIKVPSSYDAAQIRKLAEQTGISLLR